MSISLTQMDSLALAFFLIAWLVFEIVNDYSPVRKHSLSFLMAERRRAWMLEMAGRDLR
ncbi:MAG: DUF599 family protein, partial [Ahrensia sp.]